MVPLFIRKSKLIRKYLKNHMAISLTKTAVNLETWLFEERGGIPEGENTCLRVSSAVTLINFNFFLIVTGFVPGRVTNSVCGVNAMKRGVGVGKPHSVRSWLRLYWSRKLLSESYCAFALVMIVYREHTRWRSISTASHFKNKAAN